MPAKKINPKVLMSNLRVDGPLDNTATWLVLPSATIRATFAGPVIVTPGGGPQVICSFVLPAGIRPAGGIVVLTDYNVTSVSLASSIDVAVTESNGVWSMSPVVGVSPQTTGVNKQGIVNTCFDLLAWGHVDPENPLPIGNVFTVSLMATCDAADLMQINRVDLMYDYYAVIAAVGP